MGSQWSGMEIQYSNAFDQGTQALPVAPSTLKWDVRIWPENSVLPSPLWIRALLLRACNAKFMAGAFELFRPTTIAWNCGHGMKLQLITVFSLICWCAPISVHCTWWDDFLIDEAYTNPFEGRTAAFASRISFSSMTWTAITLLGHFLFQCMQVKWNT